MHALRIILSLGYSCLARLLFVLLIFCLAESADNAELPLSIISFHITIICDFCDFCETFNYIPQFLRDPCCVTCNSCPAGLFLSR